MAEESSGTAGQSTARGRSEPVELRIEAPGRHRAGGGSRGSGQGEGEPDNSSPGPSGPDPGGTAEEAEEELLFPGFVPVAFKYLDQTSKPRYYCLKLITWPYPFY